MGVYIAASDRQKCRTILLLLYRADGACSRIAATGEIGELKACRFPSLLSIYYKIVFVRIERLKEHPTLAQMVLHIDLFLNFIKLVYPRLSQSRLEIHPLARQIAPVEVGSSWNPAQLDSTSARFGQGRRGAIYLCGARRPVRGTQTGRRMKPSTWSSAYDSLPRILRAPGKIPIWPAASENSAAARPN